MDTSTATKTRQRAQLIPKLPGFRDQATAQHRRSQLSQLEGRRVSVALADGSRIDDCELVSAGRHQVHSLWLFTNGVDKFVPTDDVLDVWETA